MSVPGSGLLAALRGKSKSSQESQMTNDAKFAARSSAVHALEQAVAAGMTDTSTKKTPTGCAIDSSSFVYNLDESHPGEVQSDLTFAPVTRVPADYKEAHLGQIAVNDEFITYGLKQGHIRVLHRFSEARALLKGHTMPIADICFVGHNIVAAGGQNGELFVWRLTVQDDDNAIHVDQIVHAKFAPGCDASPVMLAPGNACLAIAVSNAVVVLDIPMDGSSLNDVEIDPLDPAPAKKMPNFPIQDTPTAVSVSADGQLLAAGSSHGRVYICALAKSAGDSIRGTAVVDADHGHAVSAVQWIHASDAESTLLVSSRHGARHALYNSPSSASNFTLGSTVAFTTSSSDASFIHTRAVAEQQLVILADTPRKAVYTLHYTTNSSEKYPVFDYLTRFKVGMSILNFAAMWDPDAGDDGAIELDCVQTEAVQQYFLDPDLCSVSTSSEDSSASPSPPLPTVASTAASTNMTVTAAVDNDVDTAAQSLNREQSIAQSTEGCPSPPSSPVAPRITVQVPVPVAIPVTDQDDSSERGESSVTGAAQKESPMTLLTPTDILRSTTPEKGGQGVNNNAASVKTQQQTATSKNKTAAVAPTILQKQQQPSTAAPASLSSDSANELLQAIRSEFAAQRAATQSFIREAIAAERAAMLAQEKTSLDKLLKTIPSRVQEAIKTEFAALSTTLGTALTPAVQSAVHTALPSETSAAVKSALEKQLSASLQTAFTKPIQDAFRHSFNKQIVPSFENACQSMFLQIDKTFTKGFNEHLEASKSAMAEPTALAASLRDALASVSTMSNADSGVLGRATSSGTIRSPKTVDTKTELKSLIDAGRYEEAFSKALGLQDVSTVSWLCTQCDVAALMTTQPPALSQMVLLSLIQQLAADLSQGTTTKLSWIREAAMALNPRDPLLTPHLKSVLTQVHKSLQGIAGRLKGSDAQSCRLAIHVVNSQMATS